MKHVLHIHRFNFTYWSEGNGGMFEVVTMAQPHPQPIVQVQP
jgi:hypothetical protein